MASNTRKMSAFIRRAEGAILRRMIKLARRVAGPAIQRILIEERQTPQQLAGSPVVRSGDSETLQRIAKVLVANSGNGKPDMSTEAVSLELARLIAPKLAAMPGNPGHGIFYPHGLHLLPKHFYLPIPDDGDQLDTFWTTPSKMVGVEMNSASQLMLIKDVLPRHLAEFRKRFPITEAKAKGEFYLLNGSYMAVDAHVYYSLIREIKPKRIVEIGTGYSTILACQAGRLNKEQYGRSPVITAIDPYPWEVFKDGLAGLNEVVPKKVQDVPLDVFTSLEAGDILFIDSTHALRSGSDVQYEFLEILPRLAPGVLVHVHDVSLPLPYPKVYYDTQTYWNEQYLLQAFLAHNSRFEVVWAGNYMLINHPDVVLETFPEFRLMKDKWTSSEPTAFWIRSK
ncbi:MULTISPECIES: class I SAM-dependent methyltransferase [Bradyrhizobium]|uniref:Predicted O-methyltransferase YrrM n=2 Tax=Bradyrhizobium TaxID=374 RepID=A0ABY0Q8S4_9BRAD|nr:MULTISPECIES: class I SAM-dependent methyltransferase [Bradyrhizobium]SDJ71296.1 Predicted O-methyltransferase YrrM [Bradyrhizobium ottawaense]SEC22239.1 Predicted O-methyltransferase YrrM [Bradyrhizobium lablabi]